MSVDSRHIKALTPHDRANYVNQHLTAIEVALKALNADVEVERTRYISEFGRSTSKEKVKMGTPRGANDKLAEADLLIKETEALVRIAHLKFIRAACLVYAQPIPLGV